VYHPATVRLVEIRLLEGPNLYRLKPAAKVQVALGDEVAWQGARDSADGVATGSGPMSRPGTGRLRSPVSPPG
jgi:hypothetical protein